MIRITVRDKIKDVVAAWERAYPGINTPMRQDILTKLKALDLSKASPKEVTAVIGNPSWVTLTCHECRKDVDVVVQAGEEYDYESRTANLCAECLEKALRLVKHIQLEKQKCRHLGQPRRPNDDFCPICRETKGFFP